MGRGRGAVGVQTFPQTFFFFKWLTNYDTSKKNKVKNWQHLNLYHTNVVKMIELISIKSTYPNKHFSTLHLDSLPKTNIGQHLYPPPDFELWRPSLLTIIVQCLKYVIYGFFLQIYCVYSFDGSSNSVWCFFYII